MSRAFVKEDDGDSQVVPARPQRLHPYYVTPANYAQLQEALAHAQSGDDARAVKDAQERLDDAIVVDPAQQNPEVVLFGARVTVEEPGKQQKTYRIVGEDEADPLHGTISWHSPLAQALLDHRIGDRVIWERPAGNLALRIAAIAYA